MPSNIAIRRCLVCMSQPTTATAGACFRWLTTGSELNRNMPSGYSDSSNACTAAMSIRGAGSVSRSASVWWSNTADAYGSSDLLPAEDPLSASQFHRETERNQQPDERRPRDAARKTVLLVEDNPIDAYVMKEVIAGCRLDVELRVAANGHDALVYLKGV